jgi:nucleotide-binding universal stress UspA family protein
VARSFAARNHGELLILHVLVPPRVLFEVTYLSPHAYQRLMADLRGGARRQLSALVTGASRKGVRATGRLLEGVPDLLILRVARDARVDMIVMGTHGRRGAARLLLGSVAARVVRLALCPVLTVSA